MTTREYFQAVLDAHISDDMDAASRQLIQKLDEKNEKRKSADTKAKVEARQRAESVLQYLKDNSGQHTRDEIAAAVGISAGQASAAVKALGEQVTKSEAKIDKAKRIVYSLA